jgi:hypothetical protein
MEFQPTGNYRSASRKLLMDVFGNEFGHTRAFIGAGMLSIAIRLQADEHRIWIWFLLGVEVFVFALVSRLASCPKLITCVSFLEQKRLVFSANDLFPI